MEFGTAGRQVNHLDGVAIAPGLQESRQCHFDAREGAAVGIGILRLWGRY